MESKQKCKLAWAYVGSFYSLKKPLNEDGVSHLCCLHMSVTLVVMKNRLILKDTTKKINQ